MTLDDLRDRVEALSQGRDGPQAVPLGDGPAALHLFRASRRSPPDNLIYEPRFCLVLQGAKAIRAADRLIPSRAGQSLLIGVDLAVATRIVEAPYLALSAPPDLPLLRDLAASLPEGRPEGREEEGTVATAEADARAAAAMARLLSLRHEAPRVAGALAALHWRELHLWMLEGPHGPMLRRLIRQDGPAQRVARAVAVIRARLALPLRVPDLAREAGMSPSSFHQHFRAVTATTPLQFQKRLRLLEARRLLREGLAVGPAAFAVGYESPTQFSRDFARAFGHPPSRERTLPEGPLLAAE